MNGVILVVAVGAVIVLAAYVGWRNRRQAKRRRPGFNSCDFCGARLRRSEDQPWRYDSVCPRCGKVQSWDE